MPETPEPPSRVEPANWDHVELWRGVRRALFACPDRFSTPTNIEGLMATDIFTLNTALAATIEDTMVKTNISDQPTKDGGSNFGRLARYGLMDDYITDIQSHLVRGIAVRDWQAFFKAHLS